MNCDSVIVGQDSRSSYLLIYLFIYLFIYIFAQAHTSCTIRQGLEQDSKAQRALIATQNYQRILHNTNLR